MTPRHPSPLSLIIPEYAVGPIAQSVEQRTFNPWVDGSSPSGPTILEQDLSAPPIRGVFAFQPLNDVGT